MIQISGANSRKIPVLRRAAAQLLSLILLLLPSSLLAQSSDDLFRGTWQVQTPEKGALVILLKNQGIASYFWGDNTDRTVYSGSWNNTDTTATIEWKDGGSHIIERTDSGFTATFKNTSGNNVYNSAAAQLPREILGQWAKPPTREDEMRSDRDKAKGFFGIWRIGDAGKYIFVESDRSAASTHGSQEAGQRGEWAKQGSELHIIWDSGEYGIFRETERSYTYKLIAAGALIEDDESEPQSAVRTIESKVPPAWFANYKVEREDDTGGLAFSSRKVARAFYRGGWIVKQGDERFEQIEVARFGGLKTSADRSLDGQWALSGQDIFMRWDDGMRKILSPVGRGFVLYEYRPGRPLDGVPSRVLAAAPADSVKLAEHLKGREDVAEQIQQMAEAAGMDPITQDDAGWGRTFARWAWPFGGEEGTTSTEQILAEEFEPVEDPDPWWWPFWSEKPDAPDENTMDSSATEEIEEVVEKTTEAPVPVELVEVEAPEEPEAEPSESNEAAEEEPAPKKRSSARDWLWPF